MCNLRPTNFIDRCVQTMRVGEELSQRTGCVELCNFHSQIHFSAIFNCIKGSINFFGVNKFENYFQKYTQLISFPNMNNTIIQSTQTLNRTEFGLKNSLPKSVF